MRETSIGSITLASTSSLRLSDEAVMTSYCFVPPLTILGLEFASLIGNAFVVELIFALDGMAAYGIRAITQKDLNAIMGVVMVSGLFFVLVNLVIDLLVGVVDPRIRIRGRRA